MKMFRLYTCFLSVLLATVTLRADETPVPIASEAELNAVIAELDNDETKMQMIDRLIELSKGRIYQVGSVFQFYPAEVEGLVDQAVAALDRHHDLATIERAMRSDDASLQFWGLWNLPVRAEGVRLIPLVREIAVGTNAHLRGRAQRILLQMPEHSEWVRTLTAEETNAWNILQLVDVRDTKKRDERFNPHLLRLLNHESAEVRRSTLVFLGGNVNSAEVWHVSISPAVVRRVLQLSHSPDDAERSGATFAIANLRPMTDEFRDRLLELADDQYEDVRWRVPGGLKGQLDQPEVAAMMKQLLRDPEPSVRYFSILTLGPEKHVAELRKLAAGDNGKFAEWAARKLRWIEEKPRTKHESGVVD